MLTVQLDTPLPEQLAVGAGTCLFLAGWCVADEGPIDALSVLVDGEERPVAAFGMPRLDVLRALGTPHSYRCGFWAWLDFHPPRCHPPRCQAPLRVGLRAIVAGEPIDTELSTIDQPQGCQAPSRVVEGSRLVVAMATYDPEPELLRAQVESIRAQTFTDWTCVISDDASDPRRFAALEEVVAGDERFVVSRSERNAGFYANFERALRLVPEGAELVALADQDDVWHPDKLATLVAEIGDAQLVYSDARLVARGGAVVSETYWRDRDRDDTLASLLVANSVTGAASLFRRDLLDLALPFPPGQFAHFHDHWLALCARVRGAIAYVDRPLYDYVQHGDAVLGHAAANQVAGLRERLTSLRGDPRDRIRVYRGIYFVDVARLTQVARILLLREPGMGRRQRRVLERFLAADRSLLAAARLWLAGAREYAGRPRTLGAERGLAYAFAWRRALAASARDVPQRGLRLDAVPPPDLAPRPGAVRTGPTRPVREMAEKIAPLTLRVRDDAPARVNLLIPTIDLAHLFGGYIGKFNLARRLAERGNRVRIVTVDPVPPLPRDWREQVSAYEGLAGMFDRVEVAFGREQPLEVSRDDRWIATTWWTAHVAAAATEDPFVYLVQEYEPFTFPAGTWGALAEQSYRFPHRALYSTELLREWFGLRGIGAALDSLSFENAITPVTPDVRVNRRLLFYARPEPHAARNLFELGMLALQRAVAEGTLDGWELRGIGTTALGRRLPLGRGAELELLSRAAQGDYGRLLSEHDVGVALMHTPHPSLVPIEMASAGMLAVTTRFENKTPAAMAAISPNILAAEPTIEGVAASIAEAVAGSADLDRRRAGADVRWARDWESAFSDALLERVEGWLSG